MKMATKDTRDGPVAVLFLSLIDRVDRLLRVSVVGRMAPKLMNDLQKGKCYYITGLEVIQIEKSNQAYIRLREK